MVYLIYLLKINPKVKSYFLLCRRSRRTRLEWHVLGGVGMILRVRLKVLKKKKPDEYKLAERYFKFLGQRTKIKTLNDRKKFAFKI